MTLLEALQDIGKGRIIDTGCDYELIALAKGLYTATTTNNIFSVELAGRPGENARNIQRCFNDFCYQTKTDHKSIIEMTYRKPKERRPEA